MVISVLVPEAVVMTVVGYDQPARHARIQKFSTGVGDPFMLNSTEYEISLELKC